MTTKTIITRLGCAALLLGGCDVKDPIHDTPHPDSGRITLVTEWHDCSAGTGIPATYTVKVGEYSATVSGTTVTVDHLFEPGNYRLVVHNTPDAITVNGTVATAAAAATPAGQTGTFIHATPGWLHAGVTNVAIEKDKEHTVTVVAHPQTHQPTLVIEPAGGTAGKIESIEGTLSGVVGTLDIDAGTCTAPSNVALAFTKITDGANTGKWSATVRLLGVADGQQRLNAKIRFTGDTPTPVTLDSDLSTALAAFNTDKHMPVTLDGAVVETPTGAVLSATITDWNPVNGSPVVAD